MTVCINLVGTRCKNGDHASLLRWYNDHVHLLFGFPALSQATLYRQLGDTASAAPQYICLYEFPEHADFLAFEHSDARERARQVVETGWAREGIEITQRCQYLRLGARAADSGIAGDAAAYILQLLGLGPAPDTARWLSDHLYQALSQQQHHRQSWYRAVAANAAGGDALIVAQVPLGAQAAALAPGWWQLAPGPDAIGVAPQPVVQRWRAPYARVLQWRR